MNMIKIIAPEGVMMKAEVKNASKNSSKNCKVNWKSGRPSPRSAGIACATLSFGLRAWAR